MGKGPIARASKKRRNHLRRNRQQRFYVIPLDVLYTRAGGVCALCGEHVDRADASIDHIIPLSDGGPHVWQNVQLAHKKCNVARGNAPHKG